MRSPRWKRQVIAWAVAASCAALLAVVERDRLIDWFVGGEAAIAAPSGDIVYTCPMDPSVEAHAPSQCPLCGMDLTPVKRTARDALLHLDPDGAKRIGLRLAAVETRLLKRRIVAFGPVSDPDPVIRATPPSVEAEVFGDDATAVAIGAAVSAVSPALPLSRFTGKVTLVRPGTTERAARMRVELDDPSNEIRAGMAAELQIEVDLPDRLVAPASAVMYAGKRRLVFVDRGNGGLELREVTLGVQDSNLVEIRAGLTAGQRIVAAGTFLAAAESRIRSSNALWDDRTLLAKTDASGKRVLTKRTAAGVQDVATPPVMPAAPKGGLPAGTADEAPASADPAGAAPADDHAPAPGPGPGMTHPPGTPGHEPPNGASPSGGQQ